MRKLITIIAVTLIVTAVFALGIGAVGAGNPGKREIKLMEQGISEGIEEFEFLYDAETIANMAKENIRKFFTDRDYCIWFHTANYRMGTVLRITVMTQERVLENVKLAF